MEEREKEKKKFNLDKTNHSKLHLSFPAPDPNFNQFGGGAALNGAGPGPGQGGGWANFPPNPPQPTKMPWAATNGTPNPFMVSGKRVNHGSCVLRYTYNDLPFSVFLFPEPGNRVTE